MAPCAIFLLIHLHVVFASCSGMKPLHHAVNNNEENIIRELIGKGADVNSPDESGNTAIHYACRRGVLGITQLLVDHKGDIMAKNAGGLTPLHVACNNGHVSALVPSHSRLFSTAAVAVTASNRPLTTALLFSASIICRSASSNT